MKRAVGVDDTAIEASVLYLCWVDGSGKVVDEGWNFPLFGWLSRRKECMQSRVTQEGGVWDQNWEKWDQHGGKLQGNRVGESIGKEITE